MVHDDGERKIGKVPTPPFVSPPSLYFFIPRVKELFLTLNLIFLSLIHI